MRYTTDAHSLVWYFAEDPRLSKKALAVFEGTVKGGSVIVPVIVLAEIMFIAQKGRVGLTFRQITNLIMYSLSVCSLVSLKNDP